MGVVAFCARPHRRRGLFNVLWGWAGRYKSLAARATPLRIAASGTLARGTQYADERVTPRRQRAPMRIATASEGRVLLLLRVTALALGPRA
jgi:hypothetical protein